MSFKIYLVHLIMELALRSLTAFFVVVFFLIVQRLLLAVGKWKSEVALAFYIICIFMAYSWFSDGFELRFFTLELIPLIAGVIVARIIRS